ncbi:MAG TPA: hypothetical protein VK900_06180 [Anaerolineales bacterium]|nr:hypothetical protein [Anaerolineales bacterium]
MILLLLQTTLRVLAVLLIGFFCAVFSAIVVINLGYGFAPGFTYNGWEGYEATGPIGFILGALIGLIGSSMLLFRRRSGK